MAPPVISTTGHNGCAQFESPDHFLSLSGKHEYGFKQSVLANPAFTSRFNSN